ncbi:MAG TPA: YIP1 family protein [Bryobacteraceae bacterium]|nr:YIP1 family protein [Bryobacteraceae bacterium]
MTAPIAEESGSVGSGILGMFNAFVDPAGLAKAAKAKLFWLWPLILVSIVTVVVLYIMTPYTLQIAEARMAQQNIPADRMDQARHMTQIISNVIPIVAPIGLVVVLVIMAFFVNLTSSMAGLRTKFRDVFALMAACTLITSLQTIATLVVLRVKGDEITSQEQMMAPFGLDIFIPAHGALLAILNFFSIFEIWYLVILGLALAYMSGSSKGKAFFAITPAWLIPLIFKIIGSFFGGASGGS